MIQRLGSPASVADPMLEVGTTYRTRGGGKLSAVCTIVEIDRDAGCYRTRGHREVAPVIRFGCEQNWVPLVLWHAESATVDDSQGFVLTRGDDVDLHSFSADLPELELQAAERNERLVKEWGR